MSHIRSRLKCKKSYKGLIDGQVMSLNPGDEFECSSDFALKLLSFYNDYFEAIERKAQLEPAQKQEEPKEEYKPAEEKSEEVEEPKEEESADEENLKEKFRSFNKKNRKNKMIKDFESK